MNIPKIFELPPPIVTTSHKSWDDPPSISRVNCCISAPGKTELKPSTAAGVKCATAAVSWPGRLGTWNPEKMRENTLLGTNISPSSRLCWVDDFPFPTLGYVSFLEGILKQKLAKETIGSCVVSPKKTASKKYPSVISLSCLWEEVHTPMEIHEILHRVEVSSAHVLFIHGQLYNDRLSWGSFLGLARKWAARASFGRNNFQRLRTTWCSSQ